MRSTLDELRALVPVGIPVPKSTQRPSSVTTCLLLKLLDSAACRDSFSSYVAVWIYGLARRKDVLFELSNLAGLCLTFSFALP